MTKKILINLPKPMLERANWMAYTENRTRSDLVREALRQYERTFAERNPGVQIGALPGAVHPSAERA